MLSVRSIPRLSIPVFIMLLAGVLFPIPAAGAVTREDIVKPFRDNIELFKEGLLDVARQGQLRLKQIEEWKAWQTRLREALAESGQRQKEENARRQAAADRIVNAGGSLTLDAAGNLHVPHLGWGVLSTLAKHRDDTNKAIAQVEGTLASGDASLHLQGLGWTTGKALDASISALGKQMTDLQAVIGAGDFQINYPGLGWVSRKSLEASVAAEEKKIAETLAVIDKGEYQVHIPNIGWITRNGLQALIKKDQDDLAALEAVFQKEEAQINRPLLGWVTLKSLHGMMDGLKKQIEDIQKSVGAATFQDNLASAGWVNGQQLQGSIDAAEKGIADVRAALAARTYAVPVAGSGSMNAQQIAEALKNPKLTPEARAALQKGLSHIPIAGQVDIAVRELEVAKLKGFLAALPRHAQPLLDKIKLDLDQRALLQGEFAPELQAHRKRLERHMRWLESCRAFIPA
jgi:hypothetical protein